MSAGKLEESAEVLADLGRRLYGAGQLPATSGNLSQRLDEKTCAITTSGTDKGHLGPGDVLAVDFSGRPLGSGKPSAETQLHTLLYERFADVGAVLHTHARSGVVLSRLRPKCSELRLRGYELSKALRGVRDPEAEIVVPIFENDQQIDRLSERVGAYLDGHPDRVTWGYLIRSHGMYAWGADAEEAWRHLEALEYLVRCELELGSHRRGGSEAGGSEP